MLRIKQTTKLLKQHANKLNQLNLVGACRLRNHYQIEKDCDIFKFRTTEKEN